MYPLFELVRLISFGHDSGVSKVSIEGFAWREVGEANLLALVCTNGAWKVNQSEVMRGHLDMMGLFDVVINALKAQF